MWSSCSKAFCIEFLIEINNDCNGMWSSSSKTCCIDFLIESNKDCNKRRHQIGTNIPTSPLRTQTCCLRWVVESPRAHRNSLLCKYSFWISHARPCGSVDDGNRPERWTFMDDGKRPMHWTFMDCFWVEKSRGGPGGNTVGSLRDKDFCCFFKPCNNCVFGGVFS
jgi:hypothetical protein